MYEENNAENLFFEADQLIENNQIVEAKEMLLELLNSYPDYGRAHNHLGWLYQVKFNNYPKAERHLKLAVKFSPDYHAAYANYAYLLIDMNKYDEMLTFGKQVLNNGIADKSLIYSKMAQALELKGNIESAYKNYKLAVKETTNNQTLESIYASINRVKGKMSFIQKLKIIKN